MSHDARSEKEERMRSRIIAFLDGDAEAIEGLFAEEIVTALRAAFREAREWITEENGEKFIN